jgi:hypothetical protein
MNVREAILKAAATIEANPRAFDFDGVVPVPECGTPGCALGWIALLAGVERLNVAGRIYWDHAQLSTFLEIPGGYPDGIFYERMDKLAGYAWHRSAELCARGLRLYADEYHPAPVVKRAGIPASVRAIFDTEVAAA